MTKTQILTIVFGVTSVILAFLLYRSINSSIVESKRIERMEGEIIDQLMMIRDAQLAFKAVNKQYTSDWEKLLSFVDSGSFYILEKKEIVITLDYGADSTYFEVDTLGTITVRDSVFNKTKYPNFDINTLALVPGIDPPVRFNMWADKINKAGLLVDAVEVWNPSPIDPRRDEESEYNTRKPLRFGSRTNVTTAGNWE